MEKPGFGKKLIEVRKAKGLTQEEVAEKCGVTVRTIQRIESGVVQPRVFTIKLISEALEFDFFEASETNFDVKIENPNSELERLHALWKMKDLFNLKTNFMKKIAILSAVFLLSGLSLFAIISEMNAKTENKKHSLTIQLNDNKTVRKIEARFSNTLTLDSLVYIKDQLKANGIKISYKKLNFDVQNKLQEISCEVDCNDGYSGSFGGFVNALNGNKNMGFVRDYSKNSERPFCTGNCGL
mgnify:CR=1 FL=1